MRNETLELEEFDESILTPKEDEIVCPVYTIPLNECSVRNFCRENGIVSYLPLKKQWKYNEYTSKGKSYKYSKVVLRPMFASYVFVKVGSEQRSELWQTRKIVNILKPSSQEEFLNELRAVRAFEVTGLDQEIDFNPTISSGDHFVIESGIWTGISGWLEKKNKRYEWTVKLEMMNRYIRTTIDPSTLVMRRLEK